MSRTTKTEWSGPDGWHISGRLERKARPAGRILDLVEAELTADDEATLVAFEAQLAHDDWWANFELNDGPWFWQDFEGLVSS